VESGIETGNLRHIRQQGLQGLDARHVVRFVQRRQGEEAGQMAEDDIVDQGRLGVAFAAMDDTVTDCDDFPAGLGGLEPLQQGIEGLGVADVVASDQLIGDFFTRTILGHHLGGGGTDAVDLTGDFRVGRNGLGEGEKGELDRRRAGVDRQNGLFHLNGFHSCGWRGQSVRQ